jgi:hypothetical protein
VSFPRPSRPAWLLVALFACSLPAVTTRIYASDEVQYYSYLRSLWFDHDLAFENEYRYFYDSGTVRNPGFHETLLERQTEAGQRINFGTIGCAILWAPFYAAGDLTARALHALGRDVAVDGYSKPYIAAVCYASAFYGFAALLLAMAAARRLGFNATLATLAVWFGTPLLFYMYVAPPMAHACSAFAVALLVSVWLRIRSTWPISGVAAIGAIAALTGMVREQDVLLACGPALDCLWWAMGSGASASRAGIRALIPRALASGIAFVGVFLPQTIAYFLLNGHFGPSHLVTRKMTWTAPHAMQVLLSPEHGFLVWTPLAVLAIAGLVWMAVSAVPTTAMDSVGLRRVVVCMLLMIALQVYTAGSVESWTVAGAFGQRRFVAITVLLVIGLAGLQHCLTTRPAVRQLARVAAILAVYWNLALMAEFATGLMDRQRLEPARNAYDAFVTVPRLAPDLAYRYLFNRASFYKKSDTER